MRQGEATNAAVPHPIPSPATLPAHLANPALLKRCSSLPFPHAVVQGALSVGVGRLLQNSIGVALQSASVTNRADPTQLGCCGRRAAG